MQKVVKKQDDDEQEGKRKKSNKMPEEPEFRYLFFYLESMTVDTEFVDVCGHETVYQKKKHQINCAVAQKSCSFC